MLTVDGLVVDPEHVAIKVEAMLPRVKTEPFLRKYAQMIDYLDCR